MAVGAGPSVGLGLAKAFLGFDGGRCRFGGSVMFILGGLCNRNRLDIMHTVVSDRYGDGDRMSEWPQTTEGMGCGQLTAPGLRR